MKRPYARYVALALMFLPIAAYHGRQASDLFRRASGSLQAAASPFGLASSGAVIGDVSGGEIVKWVRPEAAAAGLLAGDRLLQVEGEPFTGRSVLMRAMAKAGPGQTLTVRIRRETETGSTETSAIIRLTAAARPSHFIDWLQAGVLGVAMPTLCLALGFWVAAVRPGDPMAWLLLGLMVSFAQLGVGTPLHWDGWPRVPAIAYAAAAGAAWPIWMLLFGIHVGERLPVDRRWPWAKWILIGPLLAITGLAVILDVGNAERQASVAALSRMVEPIEVPLRVIMMIAIGAFFASLGFKSGTASSPDVRRRLRLLYTGTSVSMTPLFMVVLLALWRGTSPWNVAPPWVTVPAFLFLFLFPVTLAYVIVVHRALDVRVVIRQGMQYAFARTGVIVLRVAVIVAIIAAMVLLLGRRETRMVEIAGIVGVGMTLVFAMGILGEMLLRWTDRRFFRDAYNAEQILGDLGEQVRTMVETGPLLETVARRISDSLHVPRVAVLTADSSGAYRPACALGYGAPPDVWFPASAATVERLRRGGEPLRVYREDPKSWIHTDRSLAAEERGMLDRLGSQLLLPLSVKDRLPGFLGLGPKRSEEAYSRTDLRLLRSVAAQTGLALENSHLTAAIAAEVAHRELMAREVEIAREVQQRLFPQKLPVVPGLDYSGCCRPALGVGGDYFDFLALPEGQLGIAIGDVSGKGIAAALLMASLQASLRGQTIQMAGDLAKLIDTVNRLVYETSPENRYATFFYGQYQPRTRRLMYVNAGHCPPLILRRRGESLEAIRLKTGGTVIGLFGDSVYTEGSVTLATGDLLVAYTDGVSEALNNEEEEWGEQKLVEAAAGCDGMDASGVIESLLAAMDSFTAGAPPHDDVTLVVARVRPLD